MEFGASFGIPERLAELGLTLSPEALQALNALSPEHAFELLDSVAQKVHGGHIKNASNYVCATIARGYVPQASGGGRIAKQAAAPTTQFQAHTAATGSGAPAPFARRPDAANGHWQPTAGHSLPGNGVGSGAAQLASSRGMQRAQQVGLQLSDEAVQALLTLPTSHASELLEQVSERATSLRDPSNYVMATIARGFVSKASAPGGAPAPQQTFAPGSTSSVSITVGSPRAAPPHGPINLVPADVTPVESMVLQLNAEDIFPGQPMNVNTLLALRCIPEEKAMELLSTLSVKGRGKGSSINNPNNYVQAAVVKIKRQAVEGAPPFFASAGRKGGKGAAPSASFAPQSTQPDPVLAARQQAADLGVYLEDEIFNLLGQMPTESQRLLEAAQFVQGQGEDANEYIRAEAESMGLAVYLGSADSHTLEAPTKKSRWE